MRNLWPILNYEIQMYLGARYLQGFPIKLSDHNLTRLQESAMTEVKALHTRILVAILLEKTDPDNINIDDLIPTWRKENAILAHNLKNDYTKKLNIGHHPKYYLNKYLAHPDKRRGDHFDWAPIVDRMDPSLKSIFRTLPKDENLLPTLIIFGKYI